MCENRDMNSEFVPLMPVGSITFILDERRSWNGLDGPSWLVQELCVVDHDWCEIAHSDWIGHSAKLEIY